MFEKEKSAPIEVTGMFSNHQNKMPWRMNITAFFRKGARYGTFL
jgi:hypothetical protein